MKRDYVVVFSIVVAVMCVLLLIFPPSCSQKYVTHRPKSETVLRGLAQALSTYSANNGGVYPDGYGVLIFEGYVDPYALMTMRDPRTSDRLDVLAEYEWEYEDRSLISEMSEIASEYSSFVVTAWGDRASFEPDVILAYERISKLLRTTLVAFDDIRVEAIPRASAIKLIRDAGHEPVWAD